MIEIKIRPYYFHDICHTIPPVAIAISWSIFFLLSPKPGAFTAATCNPIFNLYKTKNTHSFHVMQQSSRKLKLSKLLSTHELDKSKQTRWDNLIMNNLHLLMTSVLSASPSTSSAIIMRGFLEVLANSRAGTICWIVEIFFWQRSNNASWYSTFCPKVAKTIFNYLFLF